MKQDEDCILEWNRRLLSLSLLLLLSMGRNRETTDSPAEKAQASEIAIPNQPICQQHLEIKLTA